MSKITYLICLLLLCSLDAAAQTYDQLANDYNNQALQLADKKQWVQAESKLQQALAIQPNSKTMRKNLSNIYFAHAYDLYTNSHAHAAAKKLVKQSLALNKHNINAIILLGDIEYINQNMSAAQQAWQQAAALKPENAQVQQRLEKITREALTENSMLDASDKFFIIKIDRNLKAIPNFNINQVLDKVRTEVAGDFKYKQINKIPVIIYSTSKYQATLIDAPEWSEGGYDGKLRIIMPQDSQQIPQVTSNIIHEYTHAVLDDLSNGNCPVWLNEGTAKYEESKHGVPPLTSALATAYQTNTLIAWPKINQAFTAQDKADVILAYQQAFSFVSYLIEKYGMHKFIILLKALGTTPNFSVVAQRVYHSPVATLQKDWAAWLKY